MPTYKIFYSTQYAKQLKKLNPSVAAMIIRWISKNLKNTSNPRQHGKSLSGTLGRYWRYRIENYRILAEVNDTAITIVLVEIEHRRSVYHH